MTILMGDLVMVSGVQAPLGRLTTYRAVVAGVQQHRECVRYQIDPVGWDVVDAMSAPTLVAEHHLRLLHCGYVSLGKMSRDRVLAATQDSLRAERERMRREHARMEHMRGTGEMSRGRVGSVVYEGIGLREKVEFWNRVDVGDLLLIGPAYPDPVTGEYREPAVRAYFQGRRDDGRAVEVRVLPEDAPTSDRQFSPTVDRVLEILVKKFTSMSWNQAQGLIRGTQLILDDIRQGRPSLAVPHVRVLRRQDDDQDDDRHTDEPDDGSGVEIMSLGEPSTPPPPAGPTMEQSLARIADAVDVLAEYARMLMEREHT